MIKPISPKELNENAFPDVVIQAFNNCIQRNYRNGASSFKHKEIEAEILLLSDITASEIQQKKYLDVESVYESVGWSVEYKSPDRDESFESYFIFSKSNNWLPSAFSKHSNL